MKGEITDKSHHSIRAHLFSTDFQSFQFRLMERNNGFKYTFQTISHFFFSCFEKRDCETNPLTSRRAKE